MSEETHYDYRCEDHSILLRGLEPVVLKPLVRVLPRTLTPNQITVAGQLAAGAGFVVAVLAPPSPGPLALVLLAATALFYVLADCVDGLFARHTKQTSRLGEFLDHWLDALSIPLVVLAFGLVLPAAPWLVFAATLATGFIHFTVFLHGFRRGHVHLGAIGVIEGIVVGSVVCLVVAATGPEPFARPVLGGLSVASLLMLALVGGALASLWSMRGLLRLPKDFAAVALLLGAVSIWYAAGDLSPATAGLLSIAVTAPLECRILRARLLRAPPSFRDLGLLLLVPGGALASLALGLDANLQAALAGLAIAYSALRCGRAFWRTVAELKAPAPALAAASSASATAGGL